MFNYFFYTFMSGLLLALAPGLVAMVEYLFRDSCSGVRCKRLCDLL